ncbi:hypothetical protein FAZ78_04280 [Cereibacter changlensis]|uniref:Uncharacterized protein n=1 Tax=Cereibacter changlensis TaxID=402884 RepID=A0A4U0Z5E3_9RHOB|nr:hypothetical protein [Cereibacter changlensis]TKA97761.1 hypothetical protein FAZ78_04280 [Cereibacter changlensis]
MSDKDAPAARFVEACILVAETDPADLAALKHPELQEKLRYFAPAALEALVQLDVMLQRQAAADLVEKSEAKAAAR